MSVAREVLKRELRSHFRHATIYRTNPKRVKEPINKHKDSIRDKNKVDKSKQK